MAWIAAAAMLVGAYLNHRNTVKTNKKRDAATVAGLARQRAIQDRANNRVGQTLDQMKASNAAAEQKKAGVRYLKALENAGVGGRLVGQQAEGAGSRAFRQASAESQANEGQFAADQADLYAATDAPVFQRQAESFNIGDLGADLGTLSGESRGDAALTDLKVAGVRRNPWMDLASQALMSYGQGRAAGGAGAG